MHFFWCQWWPQINPDLWASLGTFLKNNTVCAHTLHIPSNSWSITSFSTNTFSSSLESCQSKPLSIGSSSVFVFTLGFLAWGGWSFFFSRSLVSSVDVCEGRNSMLCFFSHDRSSRNDYDTPNLTWVCLCVTSACLSHCNVLLHRHWDQFP